MRSRKGERASIRPARETVFSFRSSLRDRREFLQAPP
jgi:hypothetical protein